MHAASQKPRVERLERKKTKREKLEVQSWVAGIWSSPEARRPVGRLKYHHLVIIALWAEHDKGARKRGDKDSIHLR